MKAAYSDILALTDKKPLWYDMDGVPRFARFNPDMSPNIYAKEVILLEIECQECDRRFMVEMHWHPQGGKRSIREAIDKGDLGYVRYGDPPRHGSHDERPLCYAGDTMNAESVRVVEFWRKQRPVGWKRDGKYEIRWEDHDETETETGEAKAESE